MNEDGVGLGEASSVERRASEGEGRASSIEERASEGDAAQRALQSVDGLFGGKRCDPINHTVRNQHAPRSLIRPQDTLPDWAHVRLPSYSHLAVSRQVLTTSPDVHGRGVKQSVFVCLMD